MQTLVLAVACCFPGCADREGAERLILTADLPSAEVSCERILIDLGTPDAHRHLVSGWSGDEAGRDGVTFVWSLGEASVLEFFVSRPRDLILHMVGRPFRFPGAPAQTVEVRVNDKAIESVELERGNREYTLPLRAAELRSGVNIIELVYGYARKVSDVVSSRDRRVLAVAWDEFRFEGLADTFVQSPAAEANRVRISPGCEVAFYFEATEWRTLEIQRADGSDSAEAVEILWLPDQGPEQYLAAVGLGGSQSVDLPRHDGPWKLALRVSANEGAAMGAAEVTAAITGRKRSSARPAESVSPSVSKRPNVLIYLVDTLRSDRIGCYGGPRSLTPNIDELAGEGLVFESAIAQSSWTKPAVATVLTGIGPLEHGVNHLEHRLPDEAVTLAERLRQAGYQTAAFTTNAYITEAQGFGQGFDEFKYAGVGAHEVNEWVEGWLDGRRAGAPFFAYVHVIDPHAPFEPSLQFRQLLASSVDDLQLGSIDTRKAITQGEVWLTRDLVDDLELLYDAEVAQTDDAFGILLELLRDRDLFNDTLIVLLSDHGEEFLDHGSLGHGLDLYQELLNVPLVIRPPGGGPALRIKQPVEHLDVMPTALHAAGLEPAPGLAGSNLLLFGHGRDETQGRAAFSYLENDGYEGISVTTNRWKLILPVGRWGSPSPQLFDRIADPLERCNLAARRPVIRGILTAKARNRLRLRGTGLRVDARPIDKATRADLEALGYLD